MNVCVCHEVASLIFHYIINNNKKFCVLHFIMHYYDLIVAIRVGFWSNLFIGVDYRLNVLFYYCRGVVCAIINMCDKSYLVSKIHLQIFWKLNGPQ